MNIVENTLLLAGVDDGSKNITITIGENTRKTNNLFAGKTFKAVDEAFGGVPPFSPFEKKLYGLKGVVKKFPLSILAKDWKDFLNGESLALPENELVFRSFGEIIPDRAMGEYVMNAFLRKDSPYLKFGKLDDNIEVIAEVVEGSPRLTYFRKQKVNPNGKVMMRCKFALKIKLKRALREADVSFLDTMPWTDVGRASGFYPMIKAVLNNHEKYFFSKSGNYIIKKAECEGESNARFALEQAYCGGENFFKFLNYWLMANPNHPYAKSLEQHRAMTHRGNLYAWSSSATSFFYSMVYIFNEEKEPRLIDLEHCLAFVQNLTANKVRELSIDGNNSSVYRRFYGVSVNLRVNKGDLFGDKFKEARDAAVEGLNMMIGIYREVLTYIKEKLPAAWTGFTEGHKIRMADGSEIPDMDKYGAMLVAQAISLDPLQYMEGSDSFVRFANCRVLGEFYNG